MSSKCTVVAKCPNCETKVNINVPSRIIKKAKLNNNPLILLNLKQVILKDLPKEIREYLINTKQFNSCRCKVPFHITEMMTFLTAVPLNTNDFNAFPIFQSFNMGSIGSPLSPLLTGKGLPSVKSFKGDQDYVEESSETETKVGHTKELVIQTYKF